MSYAKQNIIQSVLFVLILNLASNGCKAGCDGKSHVSSSKATRKKLVRNREKNTLNLSSPEFIPEIDPKDDTELNSFKVNQDKPEQDEGYESGNQVKKSKKNRGAKRNSKSKSKSIHSNNKYENGFDFDTDSNNQEQPINDSVIKKQETLPNDLENSIPSDIDRFIAHMRKQSDARKNIDWQLSGDELIRYVKDSRDNINNVQTTEDYATIALSIYRAAQTICELYGARGSIFKQKAKEFFEYYQHVEGINSSTHHPPKKKMTEDDWKSLLSKIDKSVILHLKIKFFNEKKKIDKKIEQKKIEREIAKKLRLAENYAGLNDIHYNITTKFKIGNEEFGLEDKKCFPLTDQQKNAYESRKTEVWYKRLDPFEQKLIDKFVPKFLRLGVDYYLPTQIRDNIGLRNAYKKTIVAYGPNKERKVLGVYYHSGSVASPNEWAEDEKARKADWEITKGNIEQIKHEEKNMEILSLNYNFDSPFGLREKKIVQDTKQAIGEEHFMNISVNVPGTVGNVEKSTNRLIDDSIKYYNKKYPDLLLETIKSQNQVQDLSNIMEKLPNPTDKRFFEQLICVKQFANASNNSVTHIMNHAKNAYRAVNDNKNADGAAKYVACKAVLTADKATNPVAFSCKSGKDRTGVIGYLSDANIISKYDPNLDPKQIHKVLAQSRHYQWLAGANGGMAGRLGIKNISFTNISKDFKSLLCLPTAQLTKINLTNDRVPEITLNDPAG